MVRTHCSACLTVLLAGLLTFLGPSHAVTKILGEGDLLLLADGRRSQYGALKILSVDNDSNRMVYAWYLLPEKVYDLGGDSVSSGTVEISQVRGRAVVAFGPFVMEWHGGGLGKGILSAQGKLGVQPLLVASSAIREPTRIQDVRSGFHYEAATPREAADPMGLAESFAKLPKVRLGVGVVQTFADIGMGAEEPVLQVKRIDPKSKAYKAGLRKGDCILSFNGLQVLTPEDFRSALEELQPGDTVVLEVYKKGSIEDISFPAEKRLSLPESSERPKQPEETDLPAHEKARLDASEEVRKRVQQSLEAIRALYFD